MKPIYLLVSVILTTSAAQAAEVISDKLKQIALQYDRSLQQVEACTEQAPDSKQAWQRLFDCLEIEYQELPDIQVTAQYIGPEIPEIQGRYRLSRDMITASPKAGGDISELLDVLPGVYSGDETLDADQQGEIKARRISISGGQPWQTGFFIDGLNFNSRQDPDAYDRSNSNINDVAGSAQAMNINERIVESLEVFDNNIPARYGGFSGGVVEVNTREAERDHFRYGVSYRGTNSDWNKYRVFVSEEDQEDPNASDPEPPEFSKHSYSMDVSGPISEHHSVLISGNYLTSTISKISLNQTEETHRENANILLKLTQHDLWLDEIEWTTTYAPYESRESLTDVLNSDIVIEGGGLSTSLKFDQGFDDFRWDGKLSFSRSENSRQAPRHYYPWIKANGRNWGVGDPDSTILISKEGGYGDIDKTQTTIALENDISDIIFSYGRSLHSFSAGFKLNYESQKRQRFDDTYVYNSPYDEVPELNCSGFLFDCVELSTTISRDQLEQQLGEPLDFNNPEHVLAYEQTVITQAQYFQLRRVYPAENIDVAVTNVSLYLEDSIDWRNFSFNLGMRYDYDNFLSNHNIAPRFSGGYRINNNDKQLLVFGLNRYYDSNLLTYKVREKRLPYRLQSRETNDDGFAQGWQDIEQSSSGRYLYTDVRTPYSDELVLGWKHGTDWGTYSIKYVKRWREDQLVTGESYYNPDDGYNYRLQVNDGHGETERVSLSWNHQLGNHSLWANTSHQFAESNSSSYDQAVDEADLHELVFLEHGDEDDPEYTETSKSNLDREVQEFGQPLVINVGWNYRWTQRLLTSVNGSYRQAYDTVVNTGSVRESEQIDRLCPECTTGTAILLPVYRKVKVPDRTLFNTSVKYQLISSQNHVLGLSADINNIFNSRTHTVVDGESGVETGRSFWFGISYDYK